MLRSMRQLPRRNCQRWFMTTTHQVQRTNGLLRRTEMHSQGFCKLFFFSDPKNSFLLLWCVSFAFFLVIHAFTLISILYLIFSLFCWKTNCILVVASLLPIVGYVNSFISLPLVCCCISSLKISLCLLEIGFDLVFLLM